MQYGAGKDWMTVLGYIRWKEKGEKEYLPRRVAINPRVDVDAGTVQLIVSDGSRVLEIDKQQAKKLLGLLQSFLYPKQVDPRQQELVRNVDGEEVPLEEP